jgi:endonuclease/exonuclease/phosphatase family metal-dependent hydrolase
MGNDKNEASFPDVYVPRLSRIVDLIVDLNSDVVCLQEFWVENDQVVDMFKSRLLQRYQWRQLNRSNRRGDGLVTLVRHGITISDHRDIIFRDLGDRVALLLYLTLPSRTPDSPPLRFSVVNTHLVFPHYQYFSIISLRELRKILAYLEMYRLLTGQDGPAAICGDFNSTPSQGQYELLRARGWRASCPPGTPWITHATHEGRSICCDYVWLLDPRARGAAPIEPGWRSLVFRSTLQWLAAAAAMPSTAAAAAADERAAAAGVSPRAAAVYDRAEDKWGMGAAELRAALERLDFGAAAVRVRACACVRVRVRACVRAYAPC